MKDFVLKKDFWLLDLIAAVSFGAFVSYALQFVADSGQFSSGNLTPAAFVGGVSYFLACVIALLLRKRFNSLPSWVWLGIGGSVVLAVLSALSSLLVDRSIPFVTHVFVISLFIVPFLLTVRTIAYIFCAAFITRPMTD